MKIIKNEIYTVSFDRVEPFTIATGISSKVDNVFLKLTGTSNTIGWGAATPNTVTAESSVSIKSSIVSIMKILNGLEFENPIEVFDAMQNKIKGNPAAKAAVDIAVHDLLSQEKGVSLSRYLGANRKSITTDITIGIMDKKETLDNLIRYQDLGFKIINIKVGLNMVKDTDRIIAVRRLCGKKVRIRVDANQGYSVKNAIQFANKIEPYDIEFIEQPVNRYDLNGLKEVTQNSPVLISADEAMHDISDAKKMIDGHYADILNIKLMKSSGIAGALKIAKYARKNKVKLKIGCMGEGRLSISAALHFALSQDNVYYADLDSWITLIGDKTKGGFWCRNGVLHPYLKRSGLGTSIKFH